MRYLVTGVAGFVGSHVAEALAERDHTVVGVDSFTSTYARACKLMNLAGLLETGGFKLIQADLTTMDLPTLLADVDGVFHFAADAGVPTSWTTDFSRSLRNNVLSTQRMFDAAVRTRTRVVLASSSSIYGNAQSYPTAETAALQPLSPYAVTKLSCEALARAYGQRGLDCITLRYFTVYGRRQRPDMAFARIADALINQLRFPLYGDGRQSRDFTHVSDAVDATLVAMEEAPRGAIYNVAAGHEATLHEVIALYERVAARRLEVSECRVASGEPRRTMSDITRIRRELGWAPKTQLAQGVTDHFCWAAAQR